MLKPVYAATFLCLSAPVWAQNPVKVRVVDENKAPVVGAVVEVTTWGEGAKPIPSALTDAMGNATFSLPKKPDVKLAAGSVSVAAKGFAFAGAMLNSENLEVGLAKGAIYRGKVMDEAGKPIEGAEIQVSGAVPDADWERAIWLRGKKISELYTVKSGADGQYQIADVPAKMSLRFGVKHPQYAIAVGPDVTPDVEAVTKLKIGGTLRGRVLDVEGKPLAGAAVYARPVPFGEGGNGGKTDENGVFTIFSLGIGTFAVGAGFEAPRKEEFVLPRQANVQVQAGKTVDLPDIRAVKGVEIRGVVRDAVTKAPLKGASVIAQQSDDTSGYGTSDATGHFKIRVQAGSHKLYLSGIPEGYIRPNLQKSIVASAEAPGAEVVFDLTKTTILRGRIVDEAGKPQKISLKIDYDTSIQSDENGKWQFSPQSERPLRLAGGDGEDGYFEVISPKTIELTTQGETDITVRQKPWQVLPGRALSADGTPLEGVKVEATFYSNQGEGDGFSESKRTATSNANGDFVLPQIRAGKDAQFLKVNGKRAGFVFQKGGEISQNGPIWRVSDLVFTPLNLQIAGKTVAGARLTAAGTEILADADGKFAFEGLAAGARVYAFKDGGFGGGEAKSPLQIELKPQTLQARDEKLAREIWTDITRETEQNAQSKSYRSLRWVERHLAPAEAASLEAQITKATDDMSILGLVNGAASRKIDFQTLETALARIKDADMRLYAYFDVAAKSDDPQVGARALQEAEIVLQNPEKETWWREINLYRAAGIAGKFAGPAAGIKALDRAVAYTLKHHGEKSTRRNGMPDQSGRDEMFAMLSESVAQGGLPLVRRLISNIEPGAGYEVRALGEAIPVLAKNGGAESVLPLFDELEKMPEPVKRDEGHTYGPETAFSMAAAKVIPLLGAKSPEKALQIARRVKGEGYTGYRAEALANAARFQTSAEAAKLWREAIAAAPTESAPRLAARAWETDKELGRELFEIVLSKTESETKSEWRSREVWANFAFYFARVDAAQARFVLEREWGAATQKKSEVDLLSKFAFAMSAIDATRAWEMARAIPADDYHASLETRRKIGQYLALSDNFRRDYPFGNRNYEEMREIDAQ